MLAGGLFLGPQSALGQGKPNIVLVFMDNFGWGEPGFNGGGVTRGAATPRLDRLAAEGLRLTNFNVEVQCTPSRSALMTGRYAIRSGNATVPIVAAVAVLGPQIAAKSSSAPMVAMAVAKIVDTVATIREFHTAF